MCVSHVCYLWYLEEDEMDEIEQDTRVIKPEKIITRLNNRGSFDYFSPFLNS